jgi:hypothetical protein
MPLPESRTAANTRLFALFDRLVGADEECGRDLEAKRLDAAGIKKGDTLQGIVTEILPTVLPLSLARWASASRSSG